jgi:hypothetical protein
MMFLVDFIIEIGKYLVATFLPSGSTSDPKFGAVIASDWTKLKPALDYWKKRFDDLEGGGVFTWSSYPDWLMFMVHASSTDYASWVTQRNAVRAKLQFDDIYPADTGPIIKDLDALVAVSEIAKFIGDSSTPPVASLSQSLLITQVGAVFSATSAPAVGSDAAQLLGIGLRAARELQDAGQRFEFARQHAQSLSPSVAFPELLALHRAEGAFCMPPATASLMHAPLILTSKDPPRTDRAFLSLPGYRFGRPSFIPTIEPLPVSTELRHLLVVLANALTLGGLDNLVAWPITFDDSQNELALLIDEAVKRDVGGIGAYVSLWKSGLATPDHKLLLEIVQGIAMARLEADPMLTGDTLIANVRTDIEGLRRYGVSGSATFFNILDDDKRTNTSKYLELTSRWYASRSRPETLLARRDRSGFMTVPRLSPYMTYLRFHSGDVIFAGLILRAAHSLAAISVQWTSAMHTASFASAISSIAGADFASALSRSDFGAITDAEKASISSALTLWRDNRTGARYIQREGVVVGESVWRHVGLLGAITAPWKPPMPSTTDPSTIRMRALADAILKAMTVIRDRRLLEPISLAIQFLPLSRLFGIADFNLKNWAPILRKTENFERLRLFMDQVRVRASLNEKGIRVP